MKKTLSNYYLLIAFIFIFVVAVVITTISYSSQQRVLNSSTHEIEEKILQSYKDELKNRTEIIEQLIDQKYSIVRKRLKDDIKKRTHEAYQIVENIYTKYKDQNTQEEIQEIIKETLRNIRFNNGRGYYFIDDVKGNCILYPIRPSVEGKNILGFQDIYKKYVIKNLIEVAKLDGQGYTSYHTYKSKPQVDTTRYEKIAFVKLFKPYDWVIGTGEYVDDVENDVKEELASIINKMRIADKTSYINIFQVHNYKGGKDFASVIVGPNMKLSDNRMIDSDVADLEENQYIEKSLALVKNSGEGYVRYKYKKLKSNEISEKLTFVKKLKQWDWVLSTGVHLDKLDSIVQTNIQKLEQIQNNNHQKTWLFLFALFLVLVIIAVIISRNISFETGKIMQFFKRAAFDKEKIDTETFYIEDFKSLAHYANEMIKSIHEEQDKLKELNNSLEDSIQEKTKELKQLNSYLKVKNRELETSFYTDNLTKLHNRNQFLVDMENNEDLRIVVFDIDGFKNINDFYGTKTGDNLLISIGNILKNFAEGKGSKAYRLSSDEFLIFCFNKDEEVLFKQTQEVVEKISQEVFFDESDNIKLNVSLTYAFAKGDSNILEKVDLALNYAKRNKLSFAIFDETNPYMNTHKHNIYWRDKIHWAIEHSLVTPYFQPIVNIKNPEEKKYEVLMRIVDGKEIITPFMFLEVAKETKQYPMLTKIMIEKSFEYFSKNDYDFSLNISILDVQNEDTVAFIKEMIQRYDIGDRILFEILESEEITSDEKFLPFVADMRNLGVKFAIDDFGSGYANFGFLLKMNPKYLKIDGDLIKEIVKNEKSYNVVKAIISFAKQIDSIVIAEFVENEAIKKVLDELGVVYMQGYYFSMPLPEV